MTGRHDHRHRLLLAMALMAVVVAGACRWHPGVLEQSARLEITPTLDGRPIEGLAGTPATVSIFGADTPYRVVRHVIAGAGTVEVSELPEGEFRLQVSLDMDPGGNGDCTSPGATTPASKPVVLANGRTTRHELPVECVIRLTTPDPVQTYAAGDVADRLPANLTFAWTPVRGARHYRYRVARYDLDGTSHEVAAGEVPGTTWSTTLDPSMPGSRYRFTVAAYGEQHRIGRLRVRIPHGGYSIIPPGYEFRVAGGEIRPGRGHLVLIPTYDGRPLDPTLDVPADLQLVRDGGGTVDEPTARLVGGAVDAGEVETGVYLASIRLDLSKVGGGARWPSGLFTPHPKHVVLQRAGEEAHVTMALYQHMMIRDVGAEPPSLRSPVTIEWDPVQGARRYEIYLVGVHPSLERRQTVTSPRWQADVPASEPGSFYLFSVTARTERAPIAWTMLHFAVQ